MARVWGVPIRLHATFVLLVGFLVWFMGSRVELRLALLQLTLLTALVACVVLHELGHAFAARRHQVPIVSITLYPFGGIAHLGERSLEPWEELRVAAAGPVVNLTVAAVLLLLTGGRPDLSPDAGWLHRALSFLLWANVFVAGLNLLPVFPLDGGRMVRAALRRRLGWARATVWTASAGQVAAVVLVWVGIFHLPWLILAGLVILPAANSELRRALVVRQLERRPVGDLRGGRSRVLPADATLEQLCDTHRDDPAAVLVLRGPGGVADAVVPDRARSLCGDADEARLRRAVPKPTAGPCVVRAKATVDQALDRLSAVGTDVAVVLDDDDRLVSVLTAAQLRRSVAWRNALRGRSPDTHQGNASDPDGA